VEGAVLIVPHRWAEDAVGAILQKSRGLPFPGPGETARSAEARILWAGPGRALLIGGELPEGLAERAAITDQGDGIAALGIAGPRVEAVLARLVPIDLRPGSFPPGRTARTLVGHMTASVTRVAGEAFEIMVMRSMAGTLLHDMTEAARLVAARP
jgi:sarcosine oxidase subunit gamma